MADPNLNESAWQRAKEDAEGVYKTTTFGVALALMGLIAAAIAVIASVGEPTTIQVAVPLLSGALAIALTFIAVLALQAWAAPLRQRNALRIAWKIEPVQEINVNLTLRDAHRRGLELLNFLGNARRSVGKPEADEITAWTNETVGFLVGRVPETVAESFISAGENQSGALQKLHAHTEALKQIIDGL